MRKSTLCISLATASLIYACSPAEKKTEKEDAVTQTECYQSSFEKDSANLKIETLSSGKVKGHLLVKYSEMPQNDGTIIGEFKGDTLYVDYTFKTGTDSTRKFTNPLAFLKKDGHLIMGVGQIETTLGRSYFVKGKPINYEKGKFTFASIPCK